MARWALKHRAQLIEHDLYATDNAALIIAETLNAPVFRLPNAVLEGDQQIGNRIAKSKIDVLISFWDPVGFPAHNADAKALLRLATACNISNACNEATADCIISSLSFEKEFLAASEEICQRARQMNPELQVIVLAGHLESEIIDRILQAGSPVTFLKKPLKFEHLVQTVTTLRGCVARSGLLSPYRARAPRLFALITLKNRARARLAWRLARAVRTEHRREAYATLRRRVVIPDALRELPRKALKL
jgi:methylglyoxal synthase